MKHQIEHKWFFHHSPAIVWSYLTDPELLSQWLMPNDFKLEIGHRFVFGAKPIRRFSFDGRIYCEVLDFEPLKMLKYSWRGGQGEKVSLDSVVTWTLEPKDGGTELTLLHTGFRGLKNYLPYLIMNKGWLKIAKRWSNKMQQSHDAA
ncbi:SRPBCC domain-containing protein [Pedobacter sp. JY14-1]|uniref:SRPBCC family protein n=1 Tax=Pedobacter sp. JY14-1 TaxID=3034151 RepID=UPI0023E27591|nr:SRPBCC domain-containing protein [Pedobacter sp. JY14-1]